MPSPAHLRPLLVSAAAFGFPGDALSSGLKAAEALILRDLQKLDGNVAVLVHQGDEELFRFQRGSIGFDTRTPLASVSKTISGAVILSAVEDGLIDLDTTFAEDLSELFSSPHEEGAGPTMGSATHRHAWEMRSGLDAAQGVEYARRFDLASSVREIAEEGELRFPPGTVLDYDGAGMQVSGWIAARRAGKTWEALARARIFDPLGMSSADYGRFGNNPSVPGGLRASASDLARFARMIMGGRAKGEPIVLSQRSIDALFVDATDGLPVQRHPWPESHPDYPLGRRPTYGFGSWVLAKDPASGRVTELAAAGAWGSVVWLDRQRGVTAVFVVNVPRGREMSQDAALGLLSITRNVIDVHQVKGLAIEGTDTHSVRLSWTAPEGASAFEVRGSDAPIEDVFALRSAEALTRTEATSATVPPHRFYAVLAQYGDHVNIAIVPGANAIERAP